MSYQLIPIHEADRQRLLRDVACSPEHHGRVRYAIQLDTFPSHWTLDADSGNYLVTLMHEDIRPEIHAERQAFRFAGAVFEVRFDDMFGDTVRIEPLCGAVIADIAAFREELTRALAVHGRYGHPRDTSLVVPDFGDWPQ